MQNHHLYWKCWFAIIILFCRSTLVQTTKLKPKATVSPSAVHLRVFHFNDVYKLNHLPKLKGFYDRHRCRSTPGSKTICTLGGDFFSPSLLSAIDQGKAMVACLSEFVDYACLGNHEADHGTKVFVNNVNQFRGTIINSNFPLLPKTRKDMPEQVTLQLFSEDQTHSRSITLLGLLESSPNLYLQDAFARGCIENAIPIQDCVQQLLRKSDNTNSGQSETDMFLPLTHQDLEYDVALAEACGCPKRLPLILGGHDHDPFDNKIVNKHSNKDDNNVPYQCRVLKAGLDGEQCIVIDIVWKTAESEYPEIEVQFVDITALDDSYSDPKLERMVEHFDAPLQRLNRSVLKALEERDFALSSVGIRHQQTSVGSLICTALRKALRADIAICNSGAIRGNRHYNTRFFTFRHLLTELPYSTDFSVIKMPGSVLEASIDYSRRAAAGNEGGSGGFLQCCNKMEVYQSKSGTWKIFSIRGVPFDSQKMYTVACTYEILKGLDNIRPLVDYIKEHPEIIPDKDAARPAKELVLQVYHKEIWLSLGNFDDIDVDGNGFITLDELRMALAKTFGINPADELVSDTLRVFDAEMDGKIYKEEYEGCIQAIKYNRFDLPASDALLLSQAASLAKFIRAARYRNNCNNNHFESPPFLKASEWNDFTKGLQKEEFEVGETILKQGDIEDQKFFYICERGSVNFIADGKTVGSSNAISENFFSFGELALLYDSPRAVTCTATSPCTLWKVNEKLFQQWLKLLANYQDSLNIFMDKSVDDGNSSP